MAVAKKTTPKKKTAVPKKKTAPRKKRATSTSLPESVNVRRAANGFVVSQYDHKTGREMTYVAKDKKELTGIMTKVGL